MTERLSGLDFLKKNEIKNKTCVMDRPFAFISYSHDEHDTQIVRNVFHTLYNRGYNLWIDTANMPHDENAWTRSALNALRNLNCTFAFFFRSESSMSKSTIAKELETIKRLRHVGDIVTVDIWHEENNTAESVYEELLNDVEDLASFDACERICNIVSIANSAIRLMADAQNDISRLADAMEEELQRRNVQPQAVAEVTETIPAKPATEEALKTSLTEPAAADTPETIPAKPAAAETPEESTFKTESVESKPAAGPSFSGQAISLPDFLAKYSNSSFKKDTFQKIRLAGAGEYAKFSTEFFDSSYLVVWDFVMKLLKEQGEAYIHFVNEKNAGAKNPPFITAQEHQHRKEQNSPVTYRRLELPGLDNYAMCRHYGQYGWVSDVLRKRIQEMGMPLDAFSFEYVEPAQAWREPVAPEAAAPESVALESAAPKTAAPVKPEEPEMPDMPAGGITKPVDLSGKIGKQRKRAAAVNGYDFDFYGQPFRGLPLNKMMLTVFRGLLDSHPDKLDLLLDKLPCLGEGIAIAPDARPATFRAGITVEIGGRSISIGTSLGQTQVKSYIERLVQLCGEPADCLIVYNEDWRNGK